MYVLVTVSFIFMVDIEVVEEAEVEVNKLQLDERVGEVVNGERGGRDES